MIVGVPTQDGLHRVCIRDLFRFAAMFRVEIRLFAYSLSYRHITSLKENLKLLE